jgi:hypothetical protein
VTKDAHTVAGHGLVGDKTRESKEPKRVRGGDLDQGGVI